MFNKIIRLFKEKSFKELYPLLDEQYGLGLFERLLCINWFNPFATLWLNLRSFPLNQAIKFPIWCYGRPKFYCLSGQMIVEGKVWSGMIRFNQVKDEAPSNMMTHSELLNKGRIIFRGQGLIGTGNKIVVGHNAVLDIGANFKITDLCNVGCYRSIIIGEQTRIVHRCQVFDTNYHYVANFNRRIVPQYTQPIHIGKGCWICNTSTINGGARLPNYTIVASNSLVNKDYSDIPESSILGGIPAKFIATGFRKIEDSRVERKIDLYYKKKPEGVFIIPEHITLDEYSYVDRFK